MKLTAKKIAQIKEVKTPGKIQLGRKSYYIKPTKFLEGVNELIASYILDEFNLIHPHYHLLYIDYNWYVISSNLNNYGDFKSAYEIGIDDITNASLYEIWAKVEDKFSNTSSKEIMFDIIKMYIFDVLFHNSDRRSDNWGILKMPKGKKVAVFDHGFLFDYDFTLEMTPYIDGEKYFNIDRLLNQEHATEKNITRFYLDSSQEFIDLFTDFLNLMTPEHLKEIFTKMKNSEEIITEDGSLPLLIMQEKDILEMYSEYYEEINNIWKSLKKPRIRLN